MFRNYLKVALRNISKHKGYSFINIIGLGIGIACCIIIFEYVAFETGYDNYHHDSDRIFRVAVETLDRDGHDFTASSIAPLAPALKEEYPQVEYASRVVALGKILVRNREIIFYQDHCILADDDLLEILTIPFIKGDRKDALTRPETVVLSESLARKLFGQENPLGKIVNIMGFDFEITGIVMDSPINTHFKYDLIASINTLEGKYPLDHWFLFNFYTYIKTVPNADTDEFAGLIRNMIYRHNKEELDLLNQHYYCFLQPVRDIHLHSRFSSEMEPPGNPVYLYSFSIIGIFILILACINFITLTTSRVVERAREIGLRKVIGAHKSILVRQFLSEVFVLTLIAAVIAVTIVESAGPYFFELAGVSSLPTALSTPTEIIFMFGLIAVVSILAGAYPAFYLSALQPVRIFKGDLLMGSRGLFRKILVSGQFTISIILAVCTLIVYRQVSYMKDYYPGFDSQQKIVVPIRGDRQARENYRSIINEFMRHPSITGGTASSDVPGMRFSRWDTWTVGEQETNSHAVNYICIDDNFIKEYKMDLLYGNNIYINIESDSIRPIIINETAYEIYGFNSYEDAVGKRLYNDARFLEITGIIRNFNYYGLQTEVEPLIMEYRPGSFSNITLTVSTSNLTETLEFIENKWKEFSPTYLFEYSFLDEVFDRQYHSEEQLRCTITLFAVLGLFIALMGLVGLSSYSAGRRFREIGIRKVLGATTLHIIRLLSKEFILLIIIANFIAWPVAYYLMNGWLQNFAYRINIGWAVFAISTVAAVTIALLTVSYQSIKAALADPVETIRYE